ncbi:proto-oncogene tyrosine-protein kinase ros [Lasius niger]|uniref:receptor protein-tyrosine kinase n=1 Tax=Lasius niger TaxID=67767 RepID=A0A0J7KEL9_LASNI|nr:proto-oncogene tyrosine-protein kinase ros [Lasius niger]
MKPFSKNEYDKCFCPYKLLEASSMQIDSTNIAKPLMYWTSKDRLIAADIYGCGCNLILSAGNQTFFNYLTIDKTNIYLFSNSSEEPIYILEKKYALLESKEDAFTRVQRVPIPLFYINKVIALDKTLQSYPLKNCLIPKKEDYQVEVLNITVNSIVVSLPEPIPNNGCEKYNLATTIYNISVSHCLDNNLNESKAFNVQTHERHYKIQNLTPFTEYRLKLALSNFYVKKLSLGLRFGTDMIVRTTPGKLNAPENVTVHFLTSTLAAVFWLPPKNLNCVTVTYEVHWMPVLVLNGTRKITYQMPRKQLINKLEQTGDGKFFTKIQLLPRQEYLVYLRVYPANFSDFFTDSVNKSVYGFGEGSNLSAVVDLTESIETPTMHYPLILCLVVTLVINVCYFYRSYRQRKATNAQVPPSITTDIELATKNEISYENIQFEQLCSAILQYNYMDELVMTEIKKEQINLSKLIGSGAFGKVFQGTVKDLERSGTTPVAIKMLRKNASLQEKKQFMEEAKLMNHFRHKHVLRLLGICLDADSPLIILELMEDGDLLKYLRESLTLQPSDSHALRLQDLLAMCEDVARGCCYLEKMHFVHRDLACRNCLISGRNRENRIVKIGDFGLARDIYMDDYYKMKREGPLPIRWMAPESLMNGIFTSQSDVWAFGVLIWEITSLGKQPYPGRNNFEVLQYVCDGGKLPKPLNCPSTLYQLMQHCWNVANNRPNFIHCLENIVTLRDNIEDAILSSADIIRHAEHDVLGYVNGDNVMPVKAEEESDDVFKRRFDKWKKGNNTAELVIAASIEEDQFEFIDGRTTARAMWLDLMRVHERKDPASKLAASEAFHNYRYESGTAMCRHIAAVKALGQRCQDLGDKLPDSQVMAKLLQGLPNKYRGVATIWRYKPEAQQNIDDLCSMLEHEEAAEDFGDVSQPTENASMDALHVGKGRKDRPKEKTTSSKKTD